MIDELKKALMARKHPGMSKHLSLSRLIRQAIPFVSSPSGCARPPLTIYFSINSVCNLCCKMCDVGTRNEKSNFYRNLRIDGKKNEISIERFKSVIKEVSPFRPMISITSTEPLLYKPLGDAVAYVRSLGMDIAVTTNGYILPRRAEELADAGLSRLNVSIDGPPTLHNKIRGRDDCFEKAVEGIYLFKGASMRKNRNAEVLVNLTITNMNYDKLVQFIDSVSEAPIDSIIFSYMNFVNDSMAEEHNEVWGSKYHASVNCLNEETNPDDVDVDVLYSQIKDVKLRNDGRISWLPDFTYAQLKTFFHEPDKFLGRSRCMVSWFIAEIIANGDVIPYARCYYIPLGNINKDSFMKIWNGERANAWRRDLKKYKRFPACSRCDQAF